MAAAPPTALAANEAIWAIENMVAPRLRAVSASEVREAFLPVPNGIAMLPGAMASCRVAGEDLGNGVIAPEGKVLGLRFRGWSIPKPVLALSPNARHHAVFLTYVSFGERSIEFCRQAGIGISFRQRLWNVPSSIRLSDLVYVDVRRRLLLAIGDAAMTDTILAYPY